MGQNSALFNDFGNLKTENEAAGTVDAGIVRMVQEARVQMEQLAEKLAREMVAWRVPLHELRAVNQLLTNGVDCVFAERLLMAQAAKVEGRTNG